MDDESRVLLRDHPERYATTGLDWGNPAHYETMGNGLFQTLMGVLAKRQGLRGTDQDRIVRSQQERIEQRLSVVDRLIWRTRQAMSQRLEDRQVIYALEKMADSFEVAAVNWIHAKAENGSQVFAGTMLGVGVGFASAVRGHHAGDRYTVGPFGGLTQISMLVTADDVMVEMEDLPRLAELVKKAREIGSGVKIDGEDAACRSFSLGIADAREKMQKRDRDAGFGY